MSIPYYLDIMSYKADPNNPRRFIPAHDKGHPLYPVEFEDDTQKTMEDCIKAVAEAAYEAGHEDGYQKGLKEDLSDPGITDAERI